MGDNDARLAAREQWSRHPAGTTLVEAAEGSRAFFEQMTSARYREQPWLPKLLESFAPRGSLLEIGCGAGTDHAELAKVAEPTIAVDLTFHGASLTRERLRFEGRSGSTVVADGEHLPFRDGSFDCVYSFGVIHHTDHPDRVAHEMYRVMRPGGRFLVGLYHKFSLFTLFKIVQYVKDGNILHQDWRTYFGQIEAGADELADPPHIELYSQGRAKRLFSRFQNLATEIVHPGVPYRLARGAWITKRMGWYVIVTGGKAAASAWDRPEISPV